MPNSTEEPDLGAAAKTIRPHMLEERAVACLVKPFSETALLGAVNAALRVS